MRRTAAAAAAACAAVATIAASTTGLAPAVAAPARTQAATIHWGACKDKPLKDAKAQCGMLRVPLDHAHPDGRHIAIAVSRVRATAPKAQRQGPLLVNPGGPGPGLTFAAYFPAVLPHKLAAQFDIVSFDPRGTGESAPLDCGYDMWAFPQPAYRPVTGPYEDPGPNEQEWLRRGTRMADACGAKYGKDLGFFGTADIVADMESIRAALGTPKINYYGYSYGTELGQIYATRYPDRVRRMVLDSNVKPEEDKYAGQAESAELIDAVMGKFFAWTARHDGVYHLGTTAAKVEDRYYDDEADLRRHGLPGFGPSEWNDTFTFTAGYDQWLWPLLASVWGKWRLGETKPMREFADDGSTPAERRNSTASFLAITCRDSPWPADYATWRRDAFASAEAAPFRTWSEVESGLACRTWPVPGREPADIGAAGVRALVLDETDEGITPYTGSLAVRRLFPDSVLVATVGGTGHATSLGGNGCVDRKVLRYLRDGTLPDRRPGAGADATCKPGKAPKPSTEDVKAARSTRFAVGGDGGDGGPGADGGAGGNAN